MATFPRYKLPVAGKKTALGVYIGEDALSYVEVAATSRGMQLLRFGDVAIVSEGGPEERQKVLQTIVSTLKRKAESKRVHIALSDSIASFFEIAVKETDPFLLKKTIQTEVARALAKEHTQLLVQSEPLFVDRNTTRVAVAVVAEEDIRNTATLFKHVGFTPVRIGLSTESVALLLAPTGANLFLNIGENETTISIVLQGSLVLEGTVAIGVNHFVESVGTRIEAGFEEMRDTLFFEGIQGNTTMLSALRMPLRKITDEIEKMFLYWHIDCKKEKECRLTDIIFFGAGALVPGLASYISSNLSLTVVVPDVFKEVPLLDGKVPDMTRAETLTHLPALALALSEFKNSAN